MAFPKHPPLELSKALIQPVKLQPEIGSGGLEGEGDEPELSVVDVGEQVSGDDARSGTSTRLTEPVPALVADDLVATGVMHIADHERVVAAAGESQEPVFVDHRRDHRTGDPVPCVPPSGMTEGNVVALTRFESRYVRVDVLLPV
jgi:hypothetical protein